MSRVRERATDVIALVAAFMLVVGFTFSDDAVEFLLDVTGHSGSLAREWLVFAADGVLVLAIAALKWHIDDGRTATAALLRRMVTGWWAVGAALVIGGHLTLIATAQHRAALGDTASAWINVLASAVFVAAMALLLFAALGEGTASRGWIVPLAVGTFVAQIASALWYPVIDVQKGCAGEISANYFSEIVNIIAVVLLALGIESNFVRRSAAARNPGHRVAPVLTVILLCVGLALSFTMLAKADLGPFCGLGAVWHEYISFVVTAQALAIGLATLVWLMIVGAVQENSDN
jgi:hypothetical protein